MKTQFIAITGINGENVENLWNIAKAAVLSVGFRDDETIYDIVAKSICTLFEKSGKIDPARGDVKNYLYTIARNEAIDEIKRQRRNSNKVDVETCSIESDDVERQTDARSKLEACDKTVKSFHEREQSIYGMLRDGYSIDEMAEKLDMSKNAVYIAIHNLRNRLKKAIA